MVRTRLNSALLDHREILFSICGSINIHILIPDERIYHLSLLEATDYKLLLILL